MAFLFVWFGIMLVCTPLGGWLVQLVSPTVPDPGAVAVEPRKLHYRQKEADALKLFEAKKYPQAALAYEQLLAVKVGEPTTTRNLILSYVEMGRFKELQERFRTHYQYYSVLTLALRDLKAATPTREHWDRAVQVASLRASLDGLRDVAQAYLQHNPPADLRPLLEAYLKENRM